MNDKEARQISLDKRKQMLKNLELARDTRAKKLAEEKNDTGEKKEKETGSGSKKKAFECVCGKGYVTKAGLGKHKKTCKVVIAVVEKEKEEPTDDEKDVGGSEQEDSDSDYTDSEDEETEAEKYKRLKREKREEEKKARREAKKIEDKKKKRKEYNETAYDNKLSKNKKNVKLEIKEEKEVVEKEVVEEKKPEPKPIPAPAPPPVKKNIVPSAEPKYHNGQEPVEKYSMAEWKALHEKQQKDRYERESRIKFEQQEQRINRLKQAMMAGGI